ncbi:MAG: hypothetical protein HKN08_06895, partial [Gammaproteobacteria bacterium]|nr:hypothetical protein [Gammaproteobacteria bacterium]
MNSQKLYTVVMAFLFALPAISHAQDDIAAILGYPDMIIYNGNLITMDDEGFNDQTGTIAEAMAIRDDSILAVGNNQEIRRLA